MLDRRSAAMCLGAAICGAAALALAAATGGLSPSFVDPDESAHYVNALFLGDWLRAGLPSPIGFARDYYAHFPKLSIGHWPPGWYALLAPLFAVLRPSPLGALALSAFVAGTPAALILWAGRRCGAGRIGWAAAGTYLLLPIVVEGARNFLLDQPVTLVVGVAAIAWMSAAERPGWARLLLFAALADAAVLIKGNGALIALVPAIDIVLARRWALLRLPALWGSAVVAAAVALPWYWLSFRIAAGGFNYAAGPGYAALALSSNLGAVLANVGWAGIALALAGGGWAWAERRERPQTARVAALAAAVIVATLLFQSAVPAAIEPRYVAPLLPWLMALAAIGAAAIWRHGTPGAQAIATILLIATAAPAVSALTRLAPKPDIGAPALAEAMRRRPGIWLVDGRAGDEGALVAAAAYADDGARRIWVARASQWLSASDFMGRGYRMTVRTPAEARALLDRLGTAGVVSVARRGRLAYPHSGLLPAALAPPAFAVARRPLAAGSGTVTSFSRTTQVPANAALLRSQAAGVAAGALPG